VRPGIVTEHPCASGEQRPLSAHAIKKMRPYADVSNYMGSVLRLSPGHPACIATRADQVYVEMKRKARDAVLAMVEREREGEQIDRALLKNVRTNFLKHLSS